MTLEQIRSTYSSYPVKYAEGQGGLPCLDVRTEQAEGRVYLHGAHVARFRPAGESPVLFVSGKSWFEGEKPIRGGVPVCWPWFGPKGDDPKAPAHGFARIQPWTLMSVTMLADGAVELVLELRPTELSWKYGFGEFVLEHRVRIGRELSMMLVTRNTGGAPFTISEALHTYLMVGDVRKVSVAGLGGVTYIDKTRNFERVTEGMALITIGGETDRLYVNTEGAVRIEDASFGRRIVVSKAGSRSTVVWNPWVEKARAMSDFGDEEYPSTICVETANAADNVVTVGPGESHSMQATIRVEKL